MGGVWQALARIEKPGAMRAAPGVQVVLAFVGLAICRLRITGAALLPPVQSDYPCRINFQSTRFSCRVNLSVMERCDIGFKNSHA